MNLSTEKQNEALSYLAEKILITERQGWSNVYKLSEEIIKKLNLVLFDKFAINTILGKPRDLSSFVYYVYTSRIAHDSHEIANFLDKNLPTETQVKMETLMIHKKTQVKVNGRLIVSLTGIRFPIKRNPIDESSVTINSLKFINSWVLLMNLYKSLSVCSKVSEWEELMIIEKELAQNVYNSFNIDKSIIGNDEPVSVNIEKVLGFLIDNPDVILVGEIALFITLSEFITVSRIEILSMLTDEDLSESLSSFLGKKVSFKTSKIITPTDNNLVRSEFSIDGQVFLYKYNILSYEVINFGIIENQEGKKIRIANIFCIFWLMITNIWIIYWLFLGDIIKENYYFFRRNEIMKLFFKFHNKIYDDDDSLSSLYSSPISPLYIYSENFIGIYKEESRYNKILNKEKLVPPYIPKVYFQNFGEYKKYK